MNSSTTAAPVNGCELACAPVMLENLAHQVLAYELAGRPGEEILRSWERRSRDAVSS